MRIIYGAKAQDQTNNLFVNLNVMKFFITLIIRRYHNAQGEIKFTSQKHSETFSFERRMLSCYKTER